MNIHSDLLVSLWSRIGTSFVRRGALCNALRLSKSLQSLDGRSYRNMSFGIVMIEQVSFATTHLRYFRIYRNRIFQKNTTKLAKIRAFSKKCSSVNISSETNTHLHTPTRCIPFLSPPVHFSVMRSHPE